MIKGGGDESLLTRERFEEEPKCAHCLAASSARGHRHPPQPTQWQPFTKPSRAASGEETVISQIRRERGFGDEVLDETWRIHLKSEEGRKDFVVTHGSPDQPAIVAHSDNSNKRNPGSSGWFTFHKESTQSDWPLTNLSHDSRLQHLTLAPPPACCCGPKNLSRAGSFWSVIPKRTQSGSSHFAGVELLFLEFHSYWFWLLHTVQSFIIKQYNLERANIFKVLKQIVKAESVYNNHTISRFKEDG